MNVMLSMFSTIFFLPSASRPFTFSRSALLSSPSTIRPSSATTDTPSTSRFVIFNATFVSSCEIGAATGSNLTEAAQLTSIVVRAGHVISADRTNQLAAPGHQPLRANRTIPGSIFVRRGRILFRIHCVRVRLLGCIRHRDRCTRLRLNPTFLGVNRSGPFFRGTFHGPKVIAQPNAGEKRVGRVGGRRERLGVCEQGAAGFLTAPGRRSKTFQHPGVGAAAGLPKGDMAAVGTRNGPADIFVGILEKLANAAVQVDIEQRLRTGESRRTRPKTLTVI